MNGYGFLLPGECYVQQEDQTDDIVSLWWAKLKSIDKVLTLASVTLFSKGRDRFLSVKKIKSFHCMVAEGLFMSNRNHLDI